MEIEGLQMAISEETGSTSNVLAARATNAQEGQVDSNHPFYIFLSNTQGFILISTLLISLENYSLWSKFMCIVLLGKNKLGFLSGTCKKKYVSC